MTTQPNNWEERFDKIAPADLEIDDVVVNLRPVIFPIKDFIRQLLSAQKQEFIKEIDKIIENHTFVCDKIATSVEKLREKIKRNPIIT